MLGKRLAGAYPPPLGYVYRAFGFLNIHDRQRWAILWPRLREHAGRKARVVDAGCGSGYWALELAARNPEWTVVGIDRNAELIRIAEDRRRLLRIDNARFQTADCLTHECNEPYDIVLSVNSAHYALPAGRGLQLFQRFQEWLEPGSGVLILLAPWCVSGRENHRVGRETTPPGFVTTSQISELCENSGLRVEVLEPRIGRFGILAKELALLSERPPFLCAALYPAQLALSFLDRRLRVDAGRSAAVLVIARPAQQTREDGHREDPYQSSISRR